ncbi:hypothetical protein GS3922_09715 [Geobacillus subterraneus]|uniref:Uncharacterized protein n=2 Tax=Geobacillus TaxID=129337 RepID=A0ABN4NHC8_9BACL|nr:hypothetical protein GS3922_09715 [Geobacillus subterraneus]KZS26701.1 hypothetical protein A5418_13325 [Geobacillus subterraneus]OXB88114.1 hypothetical protein B9L21_09600 [Geobacillus uzenensis]
MWLKREAQLPVWQRKSVLMQALTSFDLLAGGTKNERKPLSYFLKLCAKCSNKMKHNSCEETKRPVVSSMSQRQTVNIAKVEVDRINKKVVAFAHLW